MKKFGTRLLLAAHDIADEASGYAESPGKFRLIEAGVGDALADAGGEAIQSRQGSCRIFLIGCSH